MKIRLKLYIRVATVQHKPGLSNVGAVFNCTDPRYYGNGHL